MDTHTLPLNHPVFVAFLITLLTGLLAQPASAEIYQWKDASGRTHFSDKKPATTSAHDDAQKVRQTARETAARLETTINDPVGVLDEDAQQQVKAGVQKIFDIYTGLFHLNLRKPVRVDIHLFESHADLARWVAGSNKQTALPPGVLGLYMPQQNLVGAWRHSQDVNAIITTLLHESSHVLLSQLSPNAPAWLHEGLAQYFGGLDPGADGYVIHTTADAERAIDIWLERKQLVTLQQYFSLDEQRWRHLAHVEQNAVPYAVAWSVVYFLMSKPVGRQIINELLQDMEKTRRAPTADAIEKRYPGGYALMEYEWFKWAQGDKPAQTLRW